MSEKLTVSIAAQLAPLGRYRNPNGDPLAGTDLDQYTKDLVRYLAENLERFSDPRGGDVFLAISVTQGDRSSAESYRSGHFVKDPS